MNTHFTICQNCGKQVHLAPGVCVLCGHQLGVKVYVIKTPNRTVHSHEEWYRELIDAEQAA